MSEICPVCGQVIRKKRWSPPTLEEVKVYQKENPDLRNVDAYTFWTSYTKSDWADTAGKAIRNWKLKMWTWSKHADPVKPKYEPPKRRYVPSVAPVVEATDEEKAAIKARILGGPGPPGKGLTVRTAEQQKQALGV